MRESNKKTRVALLSVTSNTILILMKILAGILSGSISIISEAIHSGVDLIASLIAFLAVRGSSKPADKDHPYGHGKLENISGLAEGVLIFGAAAMIIFEAGKKIIHPTELEAAYVAIAVMVISGCINAFVSHRLHVVAKKEDSQALEADSLHLKTDVYTSLSVGLGILLVKLTGWAVLDPVVAILVAFLIIKEAYHLTRKAYDYLVDTKLSDEEEAEIIKIIENNRAYYIDYHKLKTRKAGNMKHIDFHITVDPKLTVEEAHSIIGKIKKEMCDSIHNTRVSVHIDPYREN